MLVMTIKDGQSLFIGKDVEIKIYEIKHGKARVACTAPPEVQILRENAKVREPHESRLPRQD